MNDLEWFASRTEGAPDALRRRAQEYFIEAPGIALTERLAGAGANALGAAIKADDRAGALDLLAADALITLALLAASEHDAGALADAAASLRHAVTA